MCVPFRDCVEISDAWHAVFSPTKILFPYNLVLSSFSRFTPLPSLSCTDLLCTMIDVNLPCYRCLQLSTLLGNESRFEVWSMRLPRFSLLKAPLHLDMILTVDHLSELSHFVLIAPAVKHRPFPSVCKPLRRRRRVCSPRLRYPPPKSVIIIASAFSPIHRFDLFAKNRNVLLPGWQMARSDYEYQSLA